jgi:hypothetical protein
MRRTASIAVAAGLVMLSSCTTDNSHRAPDADAPASAPSSPVKTATGKPASGRSCVQLSQIRETRVVDDRTIDFILRDRTVLRNTLPYACPNLGFERAFSYATSLSELCSVDIISVINNGGGPRIGASCGLGTFIPYTPVPAAR